MWNYLFKQILAKLVKTGTLILYFPDHSAARFGNSAAPRVTVRIVDPALIARLVRNPDLAFGEGYMEGGLTVDGDDLQGLMQIVLQNLEPSRRVWWHDLARRFRMIRRHHEQANGHRKSRRNVERHYDLSGSLFDLFLDKERYYSCAYFRSETDTLEQAQVQKVAHIAAKLLLRPGMRVLDIGCGWGGLAIRLARDHGAHVTGVTLSQEQYAFATERVRAMGLQSNVDIQLKDYRAVSGSFDRIVSVGMFEHVGVPNYRAFFGTVRDLLLPDGVAVIHTIGRAEPPGATNPFIVRHIFPGGYVPAASEVLTAIEQETLWATDVECLRLHYAKTLQVWLERFEANVEKVAMLYDERFIRMWRFYLVASEQSFRFQRQAVYQFQLARSINAVPITRDYQYSETVAHKAKGRIAAE